MDVAERACALVPEALPGLRRVKPENLHVTLAFLGETPEARLDDVTAAAREAASAVPRFRLSFDRAGRFPERGRPRVVWLGLGDGAASVARLGVLVAEALRGRALRFDDRPLSPHLTLARVREEATLAEARTVGAAVDALAVPGFGIDVSEIAVVQSVLSPRGPRYTPRATAALADTAG